MSIVISRSLFCDRCSNWFDSPNNPLAMASELRKEAQRNGWARRDREDLCPDHAVPSPSLEGGTDR